MAYLLLVATVVIIIWSLKDPFVGLLGVLMLNILRPGEVYPAFAALHLERVTAIVVLASTLAHLRGFATPKITRTVLFFWGAMILSIPMAYWVSNSIGFTIQFGQVVAYHLLIVTLVNTEQRFRTFVLTFSVLIGWLGATSLYMYMAGKFIVRMGIDRATGLTSAGDDPNTLANTLVSGLPLILLLLTRDSGKKVKLLAFAIAVAALFGVILTGSRTGFFSMVVLIAAFFATRQKRFIYVPIMVVALGIAWTFIPQQYKERYETVSNLDQDDSYQNRLRAWQAGWGMFKANPITGMGAGNFTFAAGGEYWPGEGRKLWLNAHSLPLKALGELGLLGTSAFIFMVVTLFKLNAQLKRRVAGSDLHSVLRYYPVACNFSLFVLLVAGYASHNLYRNTWFMLAATSGALQMILDARDRAQLEAAETTQTPGDSAPTTSAYS